MVLFRAVDIGAELYAMSAACTRAVMLRDSGNARGIELADVFCREARGRIEARFDDLHGKHDAALYRLAMQVLKGEHAWLEQGIVSATRKASK
jgi:hypothetical protein